MQGQFIRHSSAARGRKQFSRRFDEMLGAALSAGVALVAIASPSTSAAAVIPIDNFNSTAATWPLAVNISFGSATNSETGQAGVVGGARETTLSAGALDVFGLDDLRASIASGALDLNLTVGARGDLGLEYGTFATGGSSLNLDFTGQAGVNVTFSAFDPPSTSPGIPASITITLHDDARFTDVSTLTVPILSTGPQTVFVPFTGIALPDLAQVDGIQFAFATPDGTDFRIDTIETVVPEPALGSAMMLGALSLLAPRRRRAPREHA
jgi:hypothetical protein